MTCSYSTGVTTMLVAKCIHMSLTLFLDHGSQQQLRLNTGVQWQLLYVSADFNDLQLI